MERPRSIPIGSRLFRFCTRCDQENNEFEGLLAIHGHAVAQELGGRAIDWPAAAEAAIRGAPPFAAHVDTMVDFVQQCCGGQKGELLFELCDFVKATCGPDNMSKRRLGGTFFAAVTKLKFPGVTVNPLLRVAVVKAQATCPNRFVVDGLCKLLKLTEISRLARHPDATSAEKAMLHVRGVLLQGQVDRRRAVTMLGLFDVRVIIWMTDKSELLNRRKFKDLNEIISEFLASIAEDASLCQVRDRLLELGYTLERDRSDAPSCPKPAPTISVTSTLASVAELHDAAFLLRNTGFKVGCRIASSAPEHKGAMYLIKAITDDEVLAVKVAACMRFVSCRGNASPVARRNLIGVAALLLAATPSQCSATNV